MKELVNKLITEVGLSEEQATKSINVLVSHIKSILPAPFAANVDALISSGLSKESLAAAAAPKQEEGLMDKAGDMANAAKEKISNLTDKAGEFAGQAKDKLENFADKAEDKLEDLADKAEDFAEDAINKIKNLLKGDKKD
jgi:ElaB/YqjD/DUF883 family membrane-anchored ribosome-binding protein